MYWLGGTQTLALSICPAASLAASPDPGTHHVPAPARHLTKMAERDLASCLMDVPWDVPVLPGLVPVAQHRQWLMHAWSAGRMCNYDYLMALNAIAGRRMGT